MGMVALVADGATAAVQVPAWYTPNAGGSNPNIADFYQHQNYNGASAANKWEKNGGWCYPISVSDVLYDFTTRGYHNLLSPGITLRSP